MDPENSARLAVRYGGEEGRISVDSAGNVSTDISARPSLSKKARGPGIRAGPQIPKWLREMEGVWEETGEKVLWIPIGPWGEDSREYYFSSFFPSLSPLPPPHFC